MNSQRSEAKEPENPVARATDEVIRGVALDGAEQERVNRARAWLLVTAVVIGGVLLMIGILIASQVWPAEPVKVYSAQIAPDSTETCLFEREVTVLLDYKIDPRYDIEAIAFTQEWAALGQASQTFPGGDLHLENSKHEIPPPGHSNAEAPYQAIAPTTPDSYHLTTSVTVTYKMLGIPRTDTFEYATDGVVTVKPSLKC